MEGEWESDRSNVGFGGQSRRDRFLSDERERMGGRECATAAGHLLNGPALFCRAKDQFRTLDEKNFQNSIVENVINSNSSHARDVPRGLRQN